MQKNLCPGLKKILFSLKKARNPVDNSDLTQVMFGQAAETTAGKRGRDLVSFLKQIPLFTDLTHRDLRQLARIIHERVYRDGETIFEQGTPGEALYILRAGAVEIARKNRNGEEIPLAMLAPPASFEELAPFGDEVVHWASARARGPASLVAIGRSDLDALSSVLPRLAIKILRNLGQSVAVQFQVLLDIVNEERSVNGDSTQ
jgi:CRP-like cAMP-binding protein